MRKILFLLLLIPAIGFAQSHVLKTGTDGYVTIDGTQFMRGDLTSQYRYSDSTFCLLYSYDFTRFIKPVSRKLFWNGDINDSFYSLNALQTWWTSHGEPITGTASLDIGDTVKGGINNNLLYVNSNKKLANSNDAIGYNYTFLPTFFYDTINGGNDTLFITTPHRFTNVWNIEPMNDSSRRALYGTTIISPRGYYLSIIDTNKFYIILGSNSPTGTNNLIFGILIK